MSGDKGWKITNENISKTLKTKTAKTKPKMPSKFQKVNKSARNKLGSQSLKHLSRAKGKPSGSVRNAFRETEGDASTKHSESRPKRDLSEKELRGTTI